MICVSRKGGLRAEDNVRGVRLVVDYTSTSERGGMDVRYSSSGHAFGGFGWIVAVGGTWKDGIEGFGIRWRRKM